MYSLTAMKNGRNVDSYYLGRNLPRESAFLQDVERFKNMYPDAIIQVSNSGNTYSIESFVELLRDKSAK